jgi:hypothetical protein
MIREVKVSSNSKIVNKSNGMRKKHSGKTVNLKKTKKNMQNNKQKGGGGKESFEITTLSNVDTNKFSISKYVNSNIDWGICPGGPPSDCCVM